MIEDYFVRPVTILDAAVRDDRYGNEFSDDWDNPTARDVKGWVSSLSASENLDQRDALVTGLVLQLPAGDPITGRSRVIIDGNTDVVYEVVGEPTRPWSPRGEHRVKATLQAVAG